MSETLESTVPRAPYGRQVNGGGAAISYSGESYYGQPVLKPTHYGKLIHAYLFIGGLAGASQVIAAVAELSGREDNLPVVRAGRFVAFAGAIASPILLTADLETSGRWYNMLRIFRPTSTMSVGSWSLMAFGASAGILAGAQLLADRSGKKLYRRLGQVVVLPGAAAGSVIATYTGTLLSASSNPLWAASAGLLPVIFGLSAAATAASALSICGHFQHAPARVRRRLERLELGALAAELVATSALDQVWRRRRLDASLDEPLIAAKYRLGYKGAGLIVPLALHALRFLFRRRSAGSGILASAATLIGGYILRSVIVSAGNASTKRPGDYLRLTAAREISSNGRKAEVTAGKSQGTTSLRFRERCQNLAERLDRAVRLHAREIERQMDRIEQDMVNLRDDLIEHLRREKTAAPESTTHTGLGIINEALSLVVSVEYPVTSIQRSSLESARDTLARAVHDNTLPDC